ncbi:MAG: ComF family protein [Gemmiger sp.]
MSGKPEGARLLRIQRALALVYPRRCPFCDELLAGPAPCPACSEALEPVRHRPPRLAASEFPYLGETRAASVYYYRDAVPGAILRAKEYGHPWYARELADLMAVHLFGAQPAVSAGDAPKFLQSAGDLRPCDVLVPVPARRAGNTGLPRLLALRLAQILDVPVEPDALEHTRRTRPQKKLSAAERYKNQKGAYRLTAQGVRAVQGRRVVLVDDTITTGATVTACAEALIQGGAYSVLAVSIAADDEPPKPIPTVGEQK